MATFSQRMGLDPIPSTLQTDSMNDELRHSLWNVLYLNIFSHYKNAGYYRSLDEVESSLIEHIYANYLKQSIDEISYQVSDSIRLFKSIIISRSWKEAYNFIEFLASNTNFDKVYVFRFTNEELQHQLNVILERELSGFRFVDGYLAPITSEAEVSEIEKAIGGDHPYQGVSIHLKTALQHLSNKDNPDYRNVIKEAITAVESLCQEISGNPNATLGDGLKAIKDDIHPALNKAFIKLYGYTSNADGIRHAMTEEDSLAQEDAVFMVVACSAFINYTIAKQAS